MPNETKEVKVDFRDFESEINEFIKNSQRDAIDKVSKQVTETITKQKEGKMDRFTKEKFVELRNFVAKTYNGKEATAAEIVEAAKIEGLTEALVKNKLGYIAKTGKYSETLKVELVAGGFKITAA